MVHKNAFLHYVIILRHFIFAQQHLLRAYREVKQNAFWYQVMAALPQFEHFAEYFVVQKCIFAQQNVSKMHLQHNRAAHACYHHGVQQ